MQHSVAYPTSDRLHAVAHFMLSRSLFESNGGTF
jgi:hypothetical protein